MLVQTGYMFFEERGRACNYLRSSIRTLEGSELVCFCIAFSSFGSDHLLTVNTFMDGFHIFGDPILFHQIFQVIRYSNGMDASQTVDIQLDLFNRTTV